ncbi:MAG: tetratricopeptide repeat protein, partial [Polyangiales bacterium]
AAGGARALAATLVLAAVGAHAGLAPPPARAQRTDKPPNEAVEFYQRGREHYRQGRYREAVDDLERALMLDPGSPTLMYNLAKVHELLGHIDESIEYYEGYLEMLPADEHDERERIETTLQRLRGARDEVQAGGDPPEARTQAPPEPDDELRGGARYVTARGVADVPFWVTLASGAAVLGIGAALGGAALSKDKQADGFVLGPDGTVDDRDALQSKADRLAITADVMLVAGAGTVVAAGLLYLLRTETDELLPSGARAAVGTDGHGAVLTLGGDL